MSHKEKTTEVTSTLKGNKEGITNVKDKLKGKRKFIDHMRDFFSKEKKEFNTLTELRQASFIVAALLLLSLLSGVVGTLIISLMSLLFLLLGIQGKTFARKIIPKLPIIFLVALVLVILFWVISFML